MIAIMTKRANMLRMAMPIFLPPDFWGLAWFGSGCEGCCCSIVKTSLDGLIVAWCLEQANNGLFLTMNVGFRQREGHFWPSPPGSRLSSVVRRHVMAHP